MQITGTLFNTTPGSNSVTITSSGGTAPTGTVTLSTAYTARITFSSSLNSDLIGETLSVVINNGSQSSGSAVVVTDTIASAGTAPTINAGTQALDIFKNAIKMSGSYLTAWMSEFDSVTLSSSGGTAPTGNAAVGEDGFVWVEFSAALNSDLIGETLLGTVTVSGTSVNAGSGSSGTAVTISATVTGAPTPYLSNNYESLNLSSTKTYLYGKCFDPTASNNSVTITSSGGTAPTGTITAVDHISKAEEITRLTVTFSGALNSDLVGETLNFIVTHSGGSSPSRVGTSTIVSTGTTTNAYTGGYSTWYGSNVAADHYFNMEGSMRDSIGNAIGAQNKWIDLISPWLTTYFKQDSMIGTWSSKTEFVFPWNGGEDNWTFSVWMKPPSNFSASSFYVMRNQTVPNNSIGTFWTLNNNGTNINSSTLSVNIGGTRTDYTVNHTSAPTLASFKGSWNHLTMTRTSSSGTMKLYINGALQGTQTTGTGRLDYDELCAVRHSLRSGYAAELLIWNHVALTDSQVSSLYNSYSANSDYSP